eukprot:661482-Hanusia_phi.AAC.1
MNEYPRTSLRRAEERVIDVDMIKKVTSMKPVVKSRTMPRTQDIVPPRNTPIDEDEDDDDGEKGEDQFCTPMSVQEMTNYVIEYLFKFDDLELTKNARAKNSVLIHPLSRFFQGFCAHAPTLKFDMAVDMFFITEILVQFSTGFDCSSGLLVDISLFRKARGDRIRPGSQECGIDLFQARFVDRCWDLHNMHSSHANMTIRSWPVCQFRFSSIFSSKERIFAVALMLIGASVFAIIISNMSERWGGRGVWTTFCLNPDVGNSENDTLDQMEKVLEFMRQNRLPRALERRVQNFYFFKASRVRSSAHSSQVGPRA